MSRRNIGSMNRTAIEEPMMNLTPLIDVVFVILIMFIVVAPILELDRIDLAGHAPSSHDTSVSVQEMSPIAIYVRQNNTIMVEGRQIEIDELKSYLKTAKTRYPTARLQLFHDKKALFGTYQAVKNTAEAAGFQQLDIILKPA